MISPRHLPRQAPGERIEIFLKRHWFIFVAKVLFHLVLFVLPLIFYYYTSEDLYVRYISEISKAIFILAVSVYYLSIWLFFSASFINDFLDYWIVTNNRIININQKGLFARTVGELKLARIQDVTSEVQGFIPTFLHYGNIYIQTAGTRQRFIFKQVPNATQVAQDILHLVEKYKSEHHEYHV
jgi:uncharacterized membrane protein YdbT with pleckstrin-like domain